MVLCQGGKATSSPLWTPQAWTAQAATNDTTVVKLWGFNRCFSWIEMDDWDITFNKQNKWDSALKSGSYGLKWTFAPAKELIWDNNLKVRILPAF